ncbi:MAG: hypothetical protein ACRC1T_06020 [Clostridium chrysemydis]|uniref:hypothetical protein n=1 Tax=Clostridium chrysemydis TaxID=2665504 RepID=UPI003F2A8096
MGIYSFTRNIFNSEKKENNLFTGVIIIISICLFNIINMIYNYNIYPKSGYVERYVPASYYYPETIAKLSLEYVMRENVLILLIFATVVIVLCNYIFIKKKSKSLAFLIYSGGSFVDALRFLLYTNLRSCFGGALVGCFIGFLISPLFNKVIYLIMGVDSSILFFNLEVISVSVVYCLLQLIIVSFLDIGYVYRNDIMGLLKGEEERRLDDKRIIKIPVFLVLILISLPLIFAFTNPTFKGADGLLYLLTIISIISIFGLNYIKEDLLNLLKRTGYLYKRKRMIYWSNGLSNVKEVNLFIILFVTSIVILLKAGMEIYNFQGMKENIIIVITLMSFIICTGIVYRCILNFSNVYSRAKKLDLLGFTKSEVLEIVRKEMIIVFTFLFGIPMIIILGNIIVYSLCKISEVSYGLLLIGILLIPITISFIIVMNYTKIKIENDLYKKSEKEVLKKEDLDLRGEVNYGENN